MYSYKEIFKLWEESFLNEKVPEKNKQSLIARMGTTGPDSIIAARTLRALKAAGEIDEPIIYPGMENSNILYMITMDDCKPCEYIKTWLKQRYRPSYKLINIDRDFGSAAKGSEYLEKVTGDNRIPVLFKGHSEWKGNFNPHDTQDLEDFLGKDNIKPEIKKGIVTGDPNFSEEGSQPFTNPLHARWTHISPFGKRGGGRHYGADLFIAEGTAVRAIASGNLYRSSMTYHQVMEEIIPLLKDEGWTFEFKDNGYGNMIKVMKNGKDITSNTNVDTQVRRAIKKHAPRWLGRFKIGNYIMILHDKDHRIQGKKTVSQYMHLKDIIHPGGRVKAGEIIGTVGRTGVVKSGAHLHLGLKIGKGKGNPVDPMPYLKKITTTKKKKK